MLWRKQVLATAMVLTVGLWAAPSALAETPKPEEAEAAKETAEDAAATAEETADDAAATAEETADDAAALAKKAAIAAAEKTSVEADAAAKAAAEAAVEAADALEEASRDYDSYTDFIEGELRKVGKMDLYGVTSQLPQGYISVKYDWGSIRAASRYNGERKLGPVMAPIRFTQGDELLLGIDLGLQGWGGGHTFQISAGIIDELDWYIEIPFTYMNVSFNPKMEPVNDAGDFINPKAAALLGVADPSAYGPGDFLYKTLPALGRPTPATSYNGDWVLGDINTGFSWNFVRTPIFSAAVTPRVYFPTGVVPDPNSNLTYGTGPALETGLGGWSVGATHGFDIRIWKFDPWLDIILSNEVTWAYGFEQQRKYPTNFVTPLPQYQALDPQSFPDLSKLDGTFSYTPGWSFDWSMQLSIQLAIIGLNAGFGVSHSQEPELRAEGVEGAKFLQMAKGLELLGQQTTEMIQLGVSVSLLPLYIPADIGFSWRKVVGGQNTIVLDDFFQITVKGYIPAFLLWQ